MSCTTIARSLAKFVIEVFDKVLTDKVGSIIIVTVLREIALYLKVGDNAAVVLYRSNLCILNS